MQLHYLLFLVCSCVLLPRGHNVANALSHHPAVTAPAAAPAAPAAADNSSSSPLAPPDLISLMSKKGCKKFADLLTAGTGEVAKSFEDSIGGGITVFCPGDEVIGGFLPKFKNLTADGKASLLMYHGVPVYYSLSSLKSSNGVMNTLATDGIAKNFNFTVQNEGEAITIKTAGPIAKIKKTVYDKDPLAIYTIDAVLEPVDLFKPAEVPAPAPAPEADAPEAGKGKGKKKKKKKHVASPPAPEGPDGQPVDQKVADDNAGRKVGGQVLAVAAAVLAVVASLA